MSLEAVPEVMPWGEALRLAGLLRRDPSSWVAASMEGWAFPFSRENAAILDLFDLEHTKATKKRPKPHGGRPWIKDVEVTRHGNAAGRSPEQVKAILRSHFGHSDAPV